MNLVQRLTQDVNAEVGTFVMVNKYHGRVDYGQMVDYVVGQLRELYQSKQSQIDWQSEMRGVSFRQAVSHQVIASMSSKGLGLYEGSDVRYEEKRSPPLRHKPASFDPTFIRV